MTEITGWEKEGGLVRLGSEFVVVGILRRSAECQVLEKNERVRLGEEISFA